MFAAGGWSGVPIKAHCYTGKYKPFHNIPHSFRVTRFGFFGITQNLCDAVLHQFHDPLTIMLAIDEMSELPVTETCEFSKKIS